MIHSNHFIYSYGYLWYIHTILFTAMVIYDTSNHFVYSYGYLWYIQTILFTAMVIYDTFKPFCLQLWLFMIHSNHFVYSYGYLWYIQTILFTAMVIYDTFKSFCFEFEGIYLYHFDIVKWINLNFIFAEIHDS